MTEAGRHILFVMLNPGYVGHYQAALRLLIGRGYRVTLAYQSDRNKDGVEQAYGEALRRDCPEAVTIVRAPAREPGAWTDFVTLLRQWQDYLRYMRPEFRDAHGLRARCARETPASLRTLSSALRAAGPRLPRLAESALRRIDRLTPTSRAITEFVAVQAADMVLVTPLVDSASPQVDFVRAAQALGRPAGHCVASWDNLTNKGSMRVVPDRVFVWNPAQQVEATRLHGVPANRVVVTGAQLFDRWFTETPAHSRDDFMARVGLPADRPFLLYLGSSSFIAPQEAQFVERWIRAVRSAADPAVANASILIRPHPNNAAQYLGFDFSGFGHVVMWPPFGANMLDPSYKQDYFESMLYCAAAIGVNTSGMIEAGIVGRPVHTVLDEDFRHSQQGTLHFHHLTTAGGGLLHVAENLDHHQQLLADSLRRGNEPDPRSRAFVAAFVRPLGLERAAAPVLADAVDHMRTLRRRPRRVSLKARAVRASLYPAALSIHALSVLTRYTLSAFLVRAAVTLYVGWLWMTVGLFDLSRDWLTARHDGWRGWSRHARRYLRHTREEPIRHIQKARQQAGREVTRRYRQVTRSVVNGRRAADRMRYRTFKLAVNQQRELSKHARKSGRRAADRGWRVMGRLRRYAYAGLRKLKIVRDRRQPQDAKRPDTVART